MAQEKLLATESTRRFQEPDTRISNCVSHEAARHISVGQDSLWTNGPDEVTKSRTNSSNSSHLTRTGRAALFEFFEKKPAKRIDLVDVASIERCLTETPGSALVRRLYLLEGPDAGHARIFEERFKIEPTFFRKHQRSSNRETHHRANRTAPLPSLIDPQKMWCLDYCVLRRFVDGWEPNQSMWVRCAENGRRVELTSINGKLDKIGIIGRKASYWSRKRDNGGWDAIMVIDESVKQIISGNPEKTITQTPAQSEPYQGGCRNFIKNSQDDEPPRTCPFDDIIYYCENHSSSLNISDDPLVSTIFLQKIVASHYMSLIKYLKSLLNHLSFRLSQRTNLEDLDTKWVENGWSDLQAWNWRCRKYCDRIEAIMMSLGIEEGDARTTPSDPSANSLSRCAKDFLGIHRHLLLLRNRSEMLVGDFTGVAGIVLNREALKEANRSIQEARSVRVLTLLGKLFLPLGFSSGLLSMGGDLLPGTDKFWVFFAIVVPLILVVVALAFLVNLGYENGRG